MFWPKLSNKQIKEGVLNALSKNLDYRRERILGIPATCLDANIFYDDAPFLKDAPFLSMLVANPNHIGCHTLSEGGEPLFRGTHQLEKDLIRICAEEIFSAGSGGYDGYVASGGTEANIEACWIYRNYFISERDTAPEKIALVFSADSHYSFHKAADLLGLRKCVLPVDETTRQIDQRAARLLLAELKEQGTECFIVNVNMGSTMFGSVDDIELLADTLQLLKLDFKLHIDAAFGGFVFPFTGEETLYSFQNPLVSSVTIDGHKMLQSPYGTGIFLARKNLMHYVCTEEASYVQGKDYTLCGSRSGANAASVWMILHAHGSAGWKTRIGQLLHMTSDFCDFLDECGIEYFRDPRMNIVTIKSRYISPGIAGKYLLVPDNHAAPSWYKIVFMPHVRPGILDELKQDLLRELKTISSGHETR